MNLRSRVAGLFVLGFLSLALTGCLKADVDFRVHSNDTVSGRMIFAFDRAVLGITEQSEDEFLDEMVSDAEDELEGKSPENSLMVPGANPLNGTDKGKISVERYASKRFLGVTYQLSNVPLSELNEDSFAIVHKDNQFVLKGEIDLREETIDDSDGTSERDDKDEDEDIDLDLDYEQLFASAELRFKFTFPGDVRKSNGDVDGNSVSWEPEFGEVTEMRAVAKDSSTSSLVWALVGVGVALAGVAGIGVWWWRGRRTPGADFSPPLVTAPMTPAATPVAVEPAPESIAVVQAENTVWQRPAEPPQPPPGSTATTSAEVPQPAADTGEERK